MWLNNELSGETGGQATGGRVALAGEVGAEPLTLPILNRDAKRAVAKGEAFPYVVQRKSF